MCHNEIFCQAEGEMKLRRATILQETSYVKNELMGRELRDPVEKVPF
jgi:hypothetical protein